MCPAASAGKHRPSGNDKWLFPIPKRLSQFRNVIPTLEIHTQKRLGTVKTRFYIVEMSEG